ncbi:ribosomal protein L11 methyltransferase [Terasakiispira papahanaumokuakeensis]|uniref:Ribosomal protein L11 methyltransferase n=1 Tax=Terasakiispira papahanaumokuakeensis TaxID=197479 RepID=A0A1E2VAT7_9GAMM|nr:50S ribosomal protein L11 methyltransferase [Terasakiispira papahanaumokuakeensis]ODC03972.1 ribosomal protein L11 methyltransferase [Terasakiispira papahanaumokuakeensis]
MSWLQIKTQVAPEDAEVIEDQLLEAGACAITLSDAQDTPVFEPIRGTTPLWATTVVTGLYDGNADAAQMQQQIHQWWTTHRPEAPALQLKVEILEDKDWIREWMDSFEPLKMGDRLWVVPSWLEPPEPEAVNLRLDPGLAFGTGTHPTTALCLEWLDQQRLQGQNVIDFGCGSGILGIAALLLGASQAWGTDIDPQALEASRENARRNHLDPARFPVYFPEQCPEIQADTLVANILAGPLIDLAPTLARLVRSGGQLLLSGILAHQAEAIIEAYQPWFEMQPPVQREDWVRLTGQKR